MEGGGRKSRGLICSKGTSPLARAAHVDSAAWGSGGGGALPPDPKGDRGLGRYRRDCRGGEEGRGDPVSGVVVRARQGKGVLGLLGNVMVDCVVAVQPY